MARKTGSTDQRVLNAQHRASETGTIIKQGRIRVAVLKPSTYFVSMSSLGMQVIYQRLNALDDVVAERAFLPDTFPSRPTALLTLESETPVGNVDIIAVSVAYELEIGDLIRCLELAGLPPLAKDRGEEYPLVLLGGPLTFSNPLPVAPFADIVVMGEGDDVAAAIVRAYRDASSHRDFYDAIAELPGVLLPHRQGERLVPLARACDDDLPAASVLRTPNTELANMHLVEAERGCHRKCSFCVMRRSTNGGMRLFSPQKILATIPDDATRVGLVGAAVTDHPQLLDIVGPIVESGRGCSLSSLRADRLTPELLELLQRGGLRSITVASDGASERLRHDLEKNIREKHLRHAAQLARDFGLKLKIYMMVGVPTEGDADIDELIAFTRELATLTKVSMGIAPFVAKRNTPLDRQPFAGIKEVEQRLARLRKGLQGKAEIRATSARWAWVEYQLAQGGFEMAEAAMAAMRDGGSFAAWRRAIESARADRTLDQITN